MFEYPEEISGRTTEKLHTDENESDSKATTESDLHNMHPEEDSELFKQHFGSLSSAKKVSPSASRVAICITRLFLGRVKMKFNHDLEKSLVQYFKYPHIEN